jgi:hypothetical protein
MAPGVHWEDETSSHTRFGSPEYRTDNAHYVNYRVLTDPICRFHLSCRQVRPQCPDASHELPLALVD